VDRFWICLRTSIRSTFSPLFEGRNVKNTLIIYALGLAKLPKNQSMHYIE
jgi:hypothetical protein